MGFLLVLYIMLIIGHNICNKCGSRLKLKNNTPVVLAAQVSDPVKVTPLAPHQAAIGSCIREFVKVHGCPFCAMVAMRIVPACRWNLMIAVSLLGYGKRPKYREGRPASYHQSAPEHCSAFCGEDDLGME